MTDNQIEEIWKEAREKVEVSCDEYHSHTALAGCLSGPQDAINTCKLAEALLMERALIKKVVQSLGELMHT